MRWRRSLCVLITLCSGGSGVVQAQAHAVPAQAAPAAAPAEPTAPASEPAPAGAEAPAAAPEGSGAAASTPEAAAEQQPEPTPAPSAEAAGEAAPATLPPAPQAIPTPGEMEQLMNDQLPPSQPSNDWTAPTPVLTLHGYLRVRGELMDSFWLGRDTLPHYLDSLKEANAPDVDRDAYGSPADGQGPDPFSRFRPAEAR